MKRGFVRIAIVVGIVLLNVGCDQVTKQMARDTLQYSSTRSYLDDFFRLTYVENKGAFLSLGSELSDQLRYWVLHIFPVVLLVGLFFYALFSRSLLKWQIIALAFIIGGGISNVVDRLLHGQVVDFMNVGIGGLRTGIFNFADMSIMLGLFIMLPFAFRKQKTEPEEQSPEPSDPGNVTGR
jgi:signal peptidase II